MQRWTGGETESRLVDGLIRLSVGIEGLEDLQRISPGLERAARTLDAVPKAANG